MVTVHIDPPIPDGYVNATAILSSLRQYECRSCGALVLEISTEIHDSWHRNLIRSLHGAARSRSW